MTKSLIKIGKITTLFADHFTNNVKPRDVVTVSFYIDYRLKNDIIYSNHI